MGDEDKPAGMTAEGMAEVADAFDQILELVVGYRAKCRAQGFSEEASEQMAVGIHGVFIANLMKGAFTAPEGES